MGGPRKKVSTFCAPPPNPAKPGQTRPKTGMVQSDGGLGWSAPATTTGYHEVADVAMS